MTIDEQWRREQGGTAWSLCDSQEAQSGKAVKGSQVQGSPLGGEWALVPFKKLTIIPLKADLHVYIFRI